MNVLIVNDHPTSRKLLAAGLQGHGHDVVDAVGGTATLGALQRQPVDALVAFTPRVDGYRLCLHVRDVPGAFRRYRPAALRADERDGRVG